MIPISLKGTDIGRPGHAGSTRPLDAGYNLSGGGADIWETQDQFHFAHAPRTGDFELSVRVESLESGHHYTKAGLMVRSGLAADAAHVFLLVFPAEGARNNNNGIFEAQARAEAGGTCQAFYPPAKGVGAVEFPAVYPNVWLKLSRRDQRWTASVGRDGAAWTVYAEIELALPATVEAGLALTSHDDSRTVEARFRDIRWN